MGILKKRLGKTGVDVTTLGLGGEGVLLEKAWIRGGTNGVITAC
jgi:hypothetical protein